MIKPFKFKQFSIQHQQSAMKVGTDGVLLGSWANHPNPTKILDIGAGSGLITLMLAQRFPLANVTGVELEYLASEEAKLNVNQSKFKDRCTIIHSPIQEFNLIDSFDLIVSNPPYFSENKHLKIGERKIAREQTQITFSQLLLETKKRLNPLGKAAFIIPYIEENDFLILAESSKLFPEKITHVKGNITANVKRSLLLFSNQPKAEPQQNELIIETERHQYTKEYKTLTNDFYL